jgi:hypothetical protein
MTAEELNIAPVLHKIKGYRRKWLQLTNRMPHNRLQGIL